jgi:hypothetical protein
MNFVNSFIDSTPNIYTGKSIQVKVGLDKTAYFVFCIPTTKISSGILCPDCFAMFIKETAILSLTLIAPSIELTLKNSAKC